MRTTKMRLLLTAIVALAVLVPATAGGQPDPPQQTMATPPTPLPVTDHRCPRGLSSVDEYRTYAKRAYLRDTVSRDAHRKMAYMVKCQHESAWAKRMVHRYWKRYRQARDLRRQSEACTPFGDWAIPPHVVMRESHGQNVPNTQGSDASGFYQILRSTWLGAGGPDLKTHPRYLAMSFPKAVQDCVAHRLWSQSHSHWAQTL